MRRRATLHLEVGASSLRLEARRGGTPCWAAESPYAGVAELSERLAEVVGVKDLPPVERRVEVRLLPPVAQVRLLDNLPRVNDRALLGLLEYQPQRFFRKNGKPLVTDGVWLRRGRGTPPSAAAAAVEAPVVEAIVAGVRAAGLEIGEIRPVHPAPVVLSLLPGAERGLRLRARLRRLARGAGIAAGLWVVLGAALFVRQRRALGRVNADLAALDRPVQALLVARSRSDDVARMVVAVTESKERGARLGTLLVGLARAIPDSAFVTSVALRADGSGTLSGAARRPADLVVHLERSGLFAAPHLEGQGVREEIGGREMERFTALFGGAAR